MFAYLALSMATDVALYDGLLCGLLGKLANVNILMFKAFVWVKKEHNELVIE